MTPICGAKAKGTGKPCKRYPCPNGRCHLHGGWSTGRRTQEGKERHRAAVIKHGYYTKEAIRERREVRSLLKACKELINAVS